MSNGRIKAASIHAVLSLTILLTISFLVFRLWFPGTLAEITESKSLYWVVIAVDVICGPLLLLIIWNPKKSRRELFIDATIVTIIQISALGYGISTIYHIRPVYIVFETDRLRMVNAAEIDPIDLKKSTSSVKRLPIWGPELLSTRLPRDANELMQSIELSMAGKEPSVRPEMWEEYAPAKERIRAASRSISELITAYPDKQAKISRLAEKFDVPYASIIWLPFTHVRSMEWVALIDARNMEPFTYIPGDGFIPRR